MLRSFRDTCCLSFINARFNGQDHFVRHFITITIKCIPPQKKSDNFIAAGKAKGLSRPVAVISYESQLLSDEDLG
jgi:hypothetical protein